MYLVLGWFNVRVFGEKSWVQHYFVSEAGRDKVHATVDDLRVEWRWYHEDRSVHRAAVLKLSVNVPQVHCHGKRDVIQSIRQPANRNKQVRHCAAKNKKTNE